MFKQAKMGWLLSTFIFLLSATISHAQLLTENLEVRTLTNVGFGWQVVALENTYTDPIIVCTYTLATKTNPSATTRIRSVTSTGFEVKIQQFENNSTVTAGTVYCIISDEGAYNSGGLKYEARKTVAANTSGLSVPNGWANVNNVDVTSDVTQTYTAPVVLGQVMSFNDSDASVFWANDCDNRGNRAYQSGMSDGICVGKHIGQINGTRAAETLGYFVVESGAVTVNGIATVAAVGADTGGGVGNNPPYNYAVSGNFDMGILTQAGEDGGQGGWAVLYGTDPLPNNQVRWAIEEETVAGDTSRTHTTEQVAYWLFDNNQTPTLGATKGVNMSTEAVSPYAIPGSDVIYNITVTNSGTGPVDANSLFLVDALPPQTRFFTGDIDGPGPETTAVILTDAGSGVSFDASADIGFSDNATAPTTMTGCSYTPTGIYDTAVTHICVSPKGSMREGVITASSFTVSFRMGIE